MRRVPLRLALVGAAAALTLMPTAAQAATRATAARASQHTAIRAAQRATAHGWHPAARGGLDCNGWSPVQKTFRQMWCTEIAANSPRGFVDNGWYVGHDEPDLGFFSFRRGSANHMTYKTVLPVDPSTPPSVPFGGSTHEFQLTPAIWFGLTMCDTQSYPEGTRVCKRDSDSNVQVPPRPNHAGAAFMELQMYPPGFAPAISCDQTHWCAALTIDSLQATFGGLHGPGSPPNALLNPNCTEPVNFAFLTHSGRPVGPPGPDQQNNATFTPTSDVLLMNPGDKLTVSMHDTPAGYYTRITDNTTHQSGFMIASVANGFRQIVWDPVNFTCKGRPYAFHAMYNRALPPQANGQPRAWTTWSAHTDNVAYDVETGHFEPANAPSDTTSNDDPPCFSGPLIPGCLGSDSDFDGYPYHAGDWPNGSSKTPTPNYLTSPRSGGLAGTYPIARFETDLPRIEEGNNGGGLACDHHTGAGCSNPPPGAFYPWFHLFKGPSSLGTCSWALTNDGVPNQLSNFGGEVAGWGPLELTNYGFDKRYHNYARTIPNPCP
jgi:type II secretory pathway pseudopilin PulG